MLARLMTLMHSWLIRVTLVAGKVFARNFDTEKLCIDTVLKHCAANRKRQLSALPNVGPYIYNVSISGFTRSSIYIRH